jgi:hypothetical protein
MPKTLGEVFNDMAIKAGIAADDAALKTFLTSPEMATIQVPDALVTSIDSGLLSIEAATNNHPVVKKKYFADAYDGMDKQLLQLVASDTFDATDLEEIKAEKSTSKKAELIVSKLKAAAKTAKGADKDEINRQLTAAHDAARLAKAEVETVKQVYEGKIATIYKDAALDAAIAQYKTIYDELPGKAKILAMKAVLDDALQDKNAELKTDENGKLVLIGKDGANVFGANHTLLTPSSLMDQTFAPILKVSGPPKPAAPTRQQPNVDAKVDEKVEASVNHIKSHADKVIADMAAAPAGMI